MSEHEHTEANSHRQSVDPLRDRDGLLSADALSDAHFAHPARRAHFPKDDRRSSARLTEREQRERWPLG